MKRPPPCFQFPLVLALAAAPLVSCGGKDEAPAFEVVRPVKTVVFGGTGQQKRFTYPGKTWPNRFVDLGFEVTGQIVEFPVTKGEEVTEGQLLAKLDQRDFANDLARATAAAAEASANADRFRQASKSGAVSRAEVDLAVAREQTTAAEVRIKEKALADTEIHARFDGIVADRFVENFQNVVAKEKVLALQDVSRLEIRVDIPERDVTAVPDGDDVGILTARFDVAPDREFDLDVKEFVTEADPVTQTFKVVLAMDNPPDLELLPGMTATVNWVPPTAGGGGADTVPAMAVAGQQDRSPWVWVIDENWVVSKREVEVGAIVSGDDIQIRSGLEPGDRVAAAGVHHLAEGMKVREYRP